MLVGVPSRPLQGQVPAASPLLHRLARPEGHGGHGDRGATAAILELSAQALVDGAAEGVDVDVAVFTGSPDEGAAATEARKKEAAATASAVMMMRILF